MEEIQDWNFNQEPGGKNWSRDLGRMLFTGFLSLDHSDTFYVAQLHTLSVAPPTLG